MHFNLSQFLPQSKNIEVNGASIDSRTTERGNIFFALKGENVDGHDYVEAAFKKGAVVAIVERRIADLPAEYEDKVLKVANVEQAMQELATNLREKKIKGRVIAITGSFGKTTTRALIACVLSKFARVYSSDKNFNNHLGLPLSIINSDDNADYLVLEMGMNHGGEISLLSKIAKPDISLITYIGYSHIGNFKDQNELAAAKAEIMDYTNPNGHVIIGKTFASKTLPVLLGKARHWAGRGTLEIITDDDLSFAISTEGLHFTIGERKVIIPECYNVAVAYNSLFALAVVKILKYDIDQAMDALRDFKMVKQRGDLTKAKFKGHEIFVVNDAYNSTFDSVENAVKNCVYLKKAGMSKRLIAVIGKIAELGSFSEEIHQKMAKFLKNQDDIDIVISVGAEAGVIKSKKHFDIDPKKPNKHLTEIKNYLAEIVQDEDMILFKASHSVKLYELAEKIAKT